MGDENAHSFLSYLLNELPCCSLEYTTFVIRNQIPVHCQRVAREIWIYSNTSLIGSASQYNGNGGRNGNTINSIIIVHITVFILAHTYSVHISLNRDTSQAVRAPVIHKISKGGLNNTLPIVYFDLIGGRGNKTHYSITEYNVISF